ncbi:MAG: F0F1 ATP synthase subunit B [Planctomycetota bacterium]
MFNPALSWFGRSLIVILSGLLWVGSVTTNANAAEEKAAAQAKDGKPEAVKPAAGAHGHHDKPATLEDLASGEVDKNGHETLAGPPNPIEWKSDLALFSLIVFGLFVVILGKFAWKPLSAALDAREARIKNDIVHAEEARMKAEKMLAEYQAKLAVAQDEILKTLAEARRDAEHTRQEILAATEKEVSASKDRALQEIERTKDQALSELFNHMAGTVANATERVLGRALTDADQDRLIGDALAEFSRN